MGGFSRIPVFGRDKHDYKGLLYSKDLMLADPEDEMKVGDFIQIFGRKVETVMMDTKLAYALNAFKIGGTHMGLVRRVDLEVGSSPRFDICGVITLEDIVEEILQDEIVDETDVFIDVDRQIRGVDGRERRSLDLGIFNPMVWKHRGQQLSPEEVSGIASHLQRALFVKGSPFELSHDAIQWLVKGCKVQTKSSAITILPNAESEEDFPKDVIYKFGEQCDWCTFVLKGRLTLEVGQEAIRAEVGAFSILGKNALLPGKCFAPDFSARVATSRVRLLTINRALFLEARAIDTSTRARAAVVHCASDGEGGQPSTASSTPRCYCKSSSISTRSSARSTSPSSHRL